MSFKTTLSRLLSTTAFSLALSIGAPKLYAMENEYPTAVDSAQKLKQTVLFEGRFPEEDKISELVNRITTNQATLSPDELTKLSERIIDINQESMRDQLFTQLRKFYQEKAESSKTAEAWLTSAHIHLAGYDHWKGKPDFKKATEHYLKAAGLGNAEAKKP